MNGLFSRAAALTFSAAIFGTRFLYLAGAPSPVLAQDAEDDHFHRWLREDVLYIITPEEAEVFLDLTTNQEKEHFIEQFWRRRDTDRRTSVNEYKEEHYRRVAYANDNFTSGFPGWQTDRGMVYIKFGEPHRRDK